MAPRNTPAGVINPLSQEIARALAAEDVRAKMLAQGATPWPLSPADMATTIRTESERWKKLIADRKLEAQ